MTLLRWDVDFFWNATPNHLLKQYIMHIKANNPDALNEEKEVQRVKAFIDETPFM